VASDTVITYTWDQLAEDVNWCLLFGIKPICLIFPSQHLLITFKKLYLSKYNFTKEEKYDINMFKGPQITSEYAANSIYVFNMINRIAPLRIYMDDIEYYDYRFFDELCSLYGDIIYAYGTNKPIKTTPKGRI
jgi:hypothetical protein